MGFKKSKSLVTRETTNIGGREIDTVVFDPQLFIDENGNEIPADVVFENFARNSAMRSGMGYIDLPSGTGARFNMSSEEKEGYIERLRSVVGKMSAELALDATTEPLALGFIDTN